MLVYAALLLGCALLYYGGDWLLEGVTTMGNKLGWPKAITGLLLVSLGTSAPELFVSLSSAIQGVGAMAAGNVVGSNIINIAIVLALAVAVTVIVVERVLQLQLVAMLVLTLVSAVMLHDGSVTRIEGAILLAMTIASFIMAFKTDIPVIALDEELDAIDEDKPRSTQAAVLYTIAGIAALLVGAESLIWSGLSLATQFGLPDAVIALTVTALGTSLPEIAATLVAIIKRETSLALGNVIGSNILNLGLVLGLTAVVAPLEYINLDTTTIGFFVALAFVITALGWKPARYPKVLGPLLVAAYAGYVFVLLS